MSLENSMDEEYGSMSSSGGFGDLDPMGTPKRIKLESDVTMDGSGSSVGGGGGSLSELLRSIKSGFDMRARCEDVASSSAIGVGTNERTGGGIYGGGGSGLNNNSDAVNNNNPVKAKLADVDEAKLSEFSKFLGDSEKDENVATVLELLHENYGLIQRYASGYDCNQEKCQYENLHEHFHCYDTFCRGKVLYKKYEIIRHLKWHKKRKESLKYGFYRFSSSDDCSIQYGQCQHNHKHTHYHCVHENCDKVYISTSDVQMHANYHRKHEAIVKNGFQRFRATEECNTEHCAFKGQKTTHFHCRRENCKYTFKNKADMEKHKTYHLKDEMLLRDGYKKFLKTEDCTYKNCRFSRVCNHIHCMHENCHYVLHSSGQLLSHKRKHERMDTEVDYRKFQMAKNLLSKFGMSRSEESTSSTSKEEEDTPSSPTAASEQVPRNPVLELLAIMSELTFRTLPLQIMLHMRMQMLQNMGFEQILAPDNVENLKQLAESGLNEEYVKQLYKFNENICQLNERAMLDVTPALSELARRQGSPVPRNLINISDQFNPLKRQLEDGAVAGPSTIIQDPSFFNSPLNKSKLLSNPAIDYRLLKKDEPELNDSTAEGGPPDRQKPPLETANFLQFSSSKTLFNRKRGRPRKNHVMEVYNNAQDSPQAIFTSFKLEKNDSSKSTANPDHHRDGLSSLEAEGRFRKDLSNRSDEDDSARRFQSLSPSKMFLPMDPSLPPSMPLFGTPDFGGFSQMLEKHMREIKAEPSATVTHEVDLSCKDKSRSHLKCVVCGNSFETFADIKEHECHQAKEAEKPLLAFPPGLALHQPASFRSSYPPDVDSSSRLIYAPTPVGLPAAPSGAAKESISLVKTTGTFFPDVNANKLKYF